ncbi:hypothetical protein [Sphingobium sp. B2]|uniref:hypothetical protein n=1 Tax=Sphingobium sp. B2 TaxID=2583228 RepID=UPI00119DD57C|nr:hypothetical protein [Sphingobium sp. B2]
MILLTPDLRHALRANAISSLTFAENCTTDDRGDALLIARVIAVHFLRPLALGARDQRGERRAPDIGDEPAPKLQANGKGWRNPPIWNDGLPSTS